MSLSHKFLGSYRRRSRSAHGLIGHTNTIRLGSFVRIAVNTFLEPDYKHSHFGLEFPELGPVKIEAEHTKVEVER